MHCDVKSCHLHNKPCPASISRKRKLHEIYRKTSYHDFNSALQ